MDRGPIFIPPGLPPGVGYAHEERPPDAILYFRIYAALMLLSCLSMTGFSLYYLIDVASRRTGSTDDAAIVFMVYGVLSLLMAAPWMLAIFAGRRPWVHTLGTVMLVLTMVTLSCCLPISIPLLVVWLKPEVKRWYAAG